MDLADPRDDVLAKGGACFVCWGRDECLGVEWEVCICLGLGFSWGGIKVLSGRISLGVLLVLTVNSPGDDTLVCVGDWVLRGCQGGGYQE